MAKLAETIQSTKDERRVMKWPYLMDDKMVDEIQCRKC